MEAARGNERKLCRGPDGRIGGGKSCVGNGGNLRPANRGAAPNEDFFAGTIHVQPAFF